MARLNLPYEEAVFNTAVQNYVVDQRIDELSMTDTWEMHALRYLEEARTLLHKHGENYAPSFDDHDLIVWDKDQTPNPRQTGIKLVERRRWPRSTRDTDPSEIGQLIH